MYDKSNVDGDGESINTKESLQVVGTVIVGEYIHCNRKVLIKKALIFDKYKSDWHTYGSIILKKHDYVNTRLRTQEQHTRERRVSTDGLYTFVYNMGSCHDQLLLTIQE